MSAVLPRLGSARTDASGGTAPAWPIFARPAAHTGLIGDGSRQRVWADDWSSDGIRARAAQEGHADSVERNEGKSIRLIAGGLDISAGTVQRVQKRVKASLA